MPQMSPLQWELLFLFSLMSLIFMMSKLFFMVQQNNSVKEQVNKFNLVKFMNWQW